MRDVAGAYVRAQAFKNRPPDPRLMEELRGFVQESLKGLGLPPAEAHAALYNALRGIAWTTTMMAEYDLPLAATMDVGEQLARITVSNAPTRFDRQSVEVGVGAGYFTGLLMGLDMGVTKR